MTNNTPIHVDDLEIVGYADVLSQTMLPAVVPPVFCLKGTYYRIATRCRLFLPPYSLNAGWLCNATEVGLSELQELSDQHEVTLFKRVPFQAQRGHSLWIDREFRPHYEPHEQVEKALGQIAAENITKAESALRAGDPDEAERCCELAARVGSKRIEPLAIKAAIRRLQGSKVGEELMAEFAAPVIGENAFRALVEHYYSLVVWGRDYKEEVK